LLAFFAIWTILVYKVGHAIGRNSRDKRNLVDPPQPGQPIVLPTAIPDHARPRIEDALRRGKKIEAIKLVRECTGMGLKEAKDTVEAVVP
jgi:hypothetical protein